MLENGAIRTNSLATCQDRRLSKSRSSPRPSNVPGPPKWPKSRTLYCLYSLFWDIGPFFWALLEVECSSCLSLLAIFVTSGTGPWTGIPIGRHIWPKFKASVGPSSTEPNIILRSI